MQPSLIHVDQQQVRYAAYRVRYPDTFKGFEDRLDLSWLYHDHALEGVSLTESDVRRALAEAPARHYTEGCAYEHIRRVMTAITATHRMVGTHVGPLELSDVKGFHVLLTREGDPNAGRYRKAECPASPCQHRVTRPPSISYRLRKLVEGMSTHYAEMHPVRAAALIHHDFMTTWPFDHRSGTAGRLLLNFWLMAAGYPPAIVHATDRQAYVNALTEPPEAMVDIVIDALQTTMRSADSFFAERGTTVPTITRAGPARGLIG